MSHDHLIGMSEKEREKLYPGFAPKKKKIAKKMTVLQTYQHARKHGWRGRDKSLADVTKNKNNI